MGGNQAECQQLIRDYETEVQCAKVCKDKAKSCDTLVRAKLAGCGSTCLTYVDKDNKLAQIERMWTMAGCTAPACPVPVCLNPASASCSVLTGMCVDSAL